MSQSKYNKTLQLINRIKTHPIKYTAWSTISQFTNKDINITHKEITEGLKSKNYFSRECFLELLVKNNDSEIINELESIFQEGKSNKTSEINSLSKLRTKSDLSDEFYDKIDNSIKNNPRQELNNPLDLIDAIANIYFPEENNKYAKKIIGEIYEDKNYFLNINNKDIGKLHALFYPEYTNSKNQEYRTDKMWGFDVSGSPFEPYDQQFVGPSSIKPVMSSFLKKIHNHKKDITNKHPLQVVGESFFHQNIIHPFYDCNGRTNVLFMNLFLLSTDLPYVKMNDNDLPKFYESLNQSKPSSFVNFLGELIQRK